MVMAQPISISEHFGYRKLLRFTVPSMVMMVFTSVYSIVDGMFVSNFVGKTAFAAVNLIFPFLMVLGVVGYMLGTGGSALVAKMLGEGQKERAQRVFSLLVAAAVAVGIVFGAAGIVFLPQVSLFLGADQAMLDLCVEYGRILLLALPFFILQYMFQSLMVTAERPRMGLVVTVIAGVMNIVLDFVLIVVLHMGLRGAAWATVASQVTGGLIPVVYFLFPNGSLLRLVRPVMDWRALVLQLPVDALYRRGRGVGLRGDYVCAVYLLCGVFRLHDRVVADSELLPRGEELCRDAQYLRPQPSDYGGAGGAVDGGAGTAGLAVDGGVCGVRRGAVCAHAAGFHDIRRIVSVGGVQLLHVGLLHCTEQRRGVRPAGHGAGIGVRDGGGVCAAGGVRGWEYLVFGGCGGKPVAADVGGAAPRQPEEVSLLKQFGTLYEMLSTRSEVL